MTDVVVLFMCTVIMLAVGAVSWRYPATQWFEQRIPILFPSGMVMNLEAIACNRPINHLVIHFLMLLGAFTLVQDLAGSHLSSFLRYAMAIMVAIGALFMARRSAFQRANRKPA